MAQGDPGLGAGGGARCLSSSCRAPRAPAGWAEARAAERAGTGGAIQFFVDEVDRATRARLAAGGYAVVRAFFEMERALDDTLEPAAWPAGLELRPFAEAHAHMVHAAQQEAFADHWGFAPETYAFWRSHNLGPAADVSLWRVAWDGDEVAGLRLNRSRRGEDDTVGWVATLAVRRPWRCLGLGEALLRESLLAFAARGEAAGGPRRRRREHDERRRPL